MKVRITNMKAPWPKGSGIGAVVSFEGDTAPGWAVGKFTRVGDDVAADFAYKPAAVVGAGTGTALPAIEAVNAEIADLREKLTTAEAANEQLTFEKAAAEADAKEAREKLTTAEAALAAAPKVTATKGNGR
jgi:hypothetical protein